MQTENKQQLQNLDSTIGEMQNYLCRLEQGCEELPDAIHAADKSQLLDQLAQVMEGIGYYQKLLHYAVVLLTIDCAEELWENVSVASLNDELHRILSGICDAAESQDYSMLADFAEYDLLPAIRAAQGLLSAIQRGYMGRIM